MNMSMLQIPDYGYESLVLILFLHDDCFCYVHLLCTITMRGFTMLEKIENLLCTTFAE